MKSAVCAVLLAACAQPVVEMTLELPTTSEQVDLSCVTAVDLMQVVDGTRDSLDIGYAEQLDAQAPVSCVDLDTPPTSLDDVASQIRGKFAMGLPSGGLAAVVLRGRIGSCKDIPAFGESLFYGAGTYHSGDDALPVQVKHNLSCNQMTNSTIAMIDMAATLTAKTCTTLDGNYYDADIRPTLVTGNNLPTIVFEEGRNFVATAGGVGTLGAFQSSFAGTCPSIGMTDVANTYTIATCVDPAAPTACAAAGQLEAPMLGTNFTDVPMPPMNYSSEVVGGVWTNVGTKGPLAGATVTLDANSDAQLVYGTISATGFTPNPTATATDASGAFIVYTNQVVGVTVSATGHSDAHAYLGADPITPGAQLVVL